MQRLCVACFAAFALASAAGCPKSPEGGKTDKTVNKTDKAVTDAHKNTGGNTSAVTDKATTDKAKTNAENRDATFTLSKILTDVNVSQGGANETNIDINRNDNFKQSIKLAAQKVPEKVKVEFTPATVKAGDKAVSVMKVQAEKDAPIGTHRIRVEATPDMGNPTGIDVDINVKKP
ncbi:MAG: hypothetical protein K2X38_06910 [Gemmataceae bacterium]|nr:hypothetical protein [Gemmataceae bacterium]